MNISGDLTISEALARVEGQKAMANLAENTGNTCREKVRRFPGPVGKVPSEVEAGDVRGWILSRINKGLKPGSVNVAIAAMRFLFRNALDCPDMAELCFYPARRQWLACSFDDIVFNKA